MLAGIPNTEFNKKFSSQHDVDMCALHKTCYLHKPRVEIK